MAYMNNYPSVGDFVVLLSKKCNGQKGIVKQINYAIQLYLIELSDGTVGQLYFSQFRVV